MSIGAIIFVVALIGIDQLIKYLTLVYLKPVHSISIIDGFFSLTYVENRGAAYGSFSEYTQVLALFSLVLSALIVYAILNFDKFFKTKYIKYALYLVLAGAIGNFIDRAFRSYVVDMFQFTFIDFPVFNFADICVVVGSVIIVIMSLLYED